jgi:hypothetical protein
MREVRWRVCGSDLHMCLLKVINQSKVLLLDLYLQSIKSQYRMQVIMKQNDKQNAKFHVHKSPLGVWHGRNGRCNYVSCIDSQTSHVLETLFTFER